MLKSCGFPIITVQFREEIIEQQLLRRLGYTLDVYMYRDIKEW